MINHYKWCEKHLPEFFKQIGLNFDHAPGIIVAHGDKAYSYRGDWEDHGIPFPHGVAIFLASYMTPYSQQISWLYTNFDPKLPKVREWVIERYKEWGHLLPPVED